MAVANRSWRKTGIRATKNKLLKMIKGLFNWKILNSKEVRFVTGLVEQQWGCKVEFEEGFLQNKSGDLFLVSRALEELDLSKLSINSIGLYFGELRNDELRLSIEGSQLIGPKATKNVVVLNDDELKEWLSGNNVEKVVDSCSGYVLIKHNNDFFGCGRYKDGKILNFVPKGRRLNIAKHAVPEELS